MIADFSQPLECLARDLPAMIAAARAAGLDGHHMTALPDVVYRLRFWRTKGATGQPDAKAARPDAARVAETFKESFATPPPAMASGGPEAFYDSTRPVN